MEGSVALLVTDLPRCLLFEDDHLLVVNKPAGLNTHAASTYGGEGLYDWLRHREKRWSSLAIIHRLDKETSGVLVFAKSPLANRSLTEQFAGRSVRKRYEFLTDRPVSPGELTVRSSVTRLGDRYVSRANPTGPQAETRFQLLDPLPPGRKRVQAMPLTGRTHQIRVHAADRGFPILGDILYGGTPADRVFLHASELQIRHPETLADMTFSAAPRFDDHRETALRESFWSGEATDCYRVVHGAADKAPGWYLDRLGGCLLSASEGSEPAERGWREALEFYLCHYGARTVYHKTLRRQPGRPEGAAASPQPLLGEPVAGEFEVVENGVRYGVSFQEGYSIGLFLDQRENRRRLLTQHVAAGFELFSRPVEQTQVLNVFAYTCGFSVCAARGGSQTTSLDLSKRYLDWGQRNFDRNGIARDGHDFIYGDAFEWMQRLARKGRLFDLVILDPPTFSRSKQHGTFQAEKDYGRLISLALPLLRPGAVLLASTNAAALPPETFLHWIESAVRAGNRRITQQHYVPQPLDFPITRDEPGYLKTAWLRVA